MWHYEIKLFFPKQKDFPRGFTRQTWPPTHPGLGLSKVRYQKALAASWAPTLRAAATIKVLAAWSARAVELETLILMAMEMMFFFVLFSVVLCLFFGCVLFWFGLFCFVWSCCFWFILFGFVSFFFGGCFALLLVLVGILFLFVLFRCLFFILLFDCFFDCLFAGLLVYLLVIAVSYQV